MPLLPSSRSAGSPSAVPKRVMPRPTRVPYVRAAEVYCTLPNKGNTLSGVEIAIRPAHARISSPTTRLGQ